MPRFVGSSGRAVITKRVTTGEVLANTTVTVTVTWDSAFSNANYTAVCTVEEDSAPSLRVFRIRTKTAAAITVDVNNESLALAKTGTLHAIAFAD